jgi:short subunit dehydrogenase-like uncharacterized protein
MDTKKKYDVVVFGATSFVGKILVEYLATKYGKDAGFTWAIAGRSAKKLEALKQSLGGVATGLPTIIADSSDETSLKSLCASARVIVSTVGPYALYGEALVKICAQTGTHYCDLTGEVQWIRQMIQRYETTAKASGAKIVHCCGFDSIPSDMGVYFLQKNAQEKFGKPCTHVSMRVKSMKGEFSGGTVASLLNVVKEAAADPALRKELANPFSLCGDPNPFRARQNNVNGAQFDRNFDTWIAPFVMAAINTRIVHRSNLLGKSHYGKNFTYDEAMITGKGVKGSLGSIAISAVMGGFMVAAAIKPSRWFLEKFVVPKPGEGPSKTSQEHGFYDLRFMGLTEHNEVIRAKVTGDRDPGYGSTAKMLGEAALCLALEVSAKTSGGFWTPSTIFKDKLLTRLEKNAGLAFELKNE